MTAIRLSSIGLLWLSDMFRRGPTHETHSVTIKSKASVILDECKELCPQVYDSVQTYASAAPGFAFLLNNK